VTDEGGYVFSEEEWHTTFFYSHITP